MRYDARQPDKQTLQKSNAGRVKKAAVRLPRISTQQRPQNHCKGGNEGYADRVWKSLNNAENVCFNADWKLDWA